MKQEITDEILKMIDARINSKMTAMKDTHLAIEIAQEVLDSYKKGEAENDMFSSLKSFGLQSFRIVQIHNQYDNKTIHNAIKITENAIANGNITNPAGFFIKMLGEKSVQYKASVARKSNESLADKDWLKVREQFINKCGLDTFNAWLKDIVLVEKGREVKLKCKSRFVADSIKRDYAPRLQALWQRINSDVQSIKFVY